MKVFLKQVEGTQIFENTNEKGQKISISSEGEAVSPMQAVLMAAASCSTTDVIMILEKMRQPLEEIRVEVDGTRRDEIPRIYTKIHMHYVLTGDLKEKKVRQAIDLSLGKYCSVTQMLNKTAEVSSSFEIIQS